MFVVFPSFIAVAEKQVKSDSLSISQIQLFYKLIESKFNDETKMYARDNIEYNLLLMCNPDNLGEIVPQFVLYPRESKSKVMSSVTSLVRKCIASGQYKEPYRYLRSGRQAWNTPQFAWRFSSFTDRDRRDFLKIYVEQLNEGGYNDWIAKIQKRECDDYYNAILARLRYLHLLLKTLHAKEKDDELFSQLWYEFDHLGQRLDILLNLEHKIPSFKNLGLDLQESKIFEIFPLILPVPEFLPTGDAREYMSLEWE
jgi:hypothetical protein